MTRLMLVLLLLGSATMAFGETFECRDPAGDKSSPVLVVATVSDDRESGTIEVARVKYEATYWVNGFDRVWAWDYDDEAPQFLFIIEPNGAGLYFYGNRMFLPDQEFKCRER